MKHSWTGTLYCYLLIIIVCTSGFIAAQPSFTLFGSAHHEYPANLSNAFRQKVGHVNVAVNPIGIFVLLKQAARWVCSLFSDEDERTQPAAPVITQHYAADRVTTMPVPSEQQIPGFLPAHNTAHAPPIIPTVQQSVPVTQPIIPLSDDLRTLAQQHNATSAPYSNHARYEHRKSALAAMVARSQQIIQTRAFTLSHELTTELDTRSLDPQLFVQCTGNLLQLVFHDEIIQIMNTSIAYCKKTELSQWPAIIIDFASLAYEYNQAALLLKAHTIIDFCWGLLECTQAALEGVAQAACNIGSSTYETFRHPLQTVHHVGKTAYLFAKILSFAEVAADSDFYITTNQWNEYVNIQERQSRVIETMSTLIAEKAQSMQPRDYVKGTVCVITEQILAGKCCTYLTNFFNIAAQRSRLLVAAVHDGQEASKIITNTAAIENLTVEIAEQSTFALANTVQEVGTDAAKIQQALAELGNFIPIEQHLPILQQYDSLAAGCIKKMEFSLQHFFVGETYKNGKLGGLHHDYMGYLEKLGKIKVTKIFDNGMYVAKVWHNGKWHDKTFFSKFWTREHVLEEAIKFYNTHHLNGEKQGIHFIIKAFLDGIKIKMVIKNDNTIHSFFPYIKEINKSCTL